MINHHHQTQPLEVGFSHHLSKNAGESLWMMINGTYKNSSSSHIFWQKEPNELVMRLAVPQLGSNGSFCDCAYRRSWGVALICGLIQTYQIFGSTIPKKTLSSPAKSAQLLATKPKFCLSKSVFWWTKMICWRMSCQVMMLASLVKSTLTLQGTNISHRKGKRKNHRLKSVG